MSRVTPIFEFGPPNHFEKSTPLHACMVNPCMLRQPITILGLEVNIDTVYVSGRYIHCHYVWCNRDRSIRVPFHLAKKWSNNRAENIDTEDIDTSKCTNQSNQINQSINQSINAHAVGKGTRESCSLSSDSASWGVRLPSGGNELWFTRRHWNLKASSVPFAS